jgi:hypothetical protein
VRYAFGESLVPGDFGHSMPVTFSGYTTGQTLTNFPVLVKLSALVTATCGAMVLICVLLTVIAPLTVLEGNIPASLFIVH